MMQATNLKSSQLFSPRRLADLELRNRIVVSPMCQYSAIDGVAQPWHAMNTGQYAISGAGLVIMEATAVEEIGRTSLHCLGLYTDRQEQALKTMLDGVRTYSNTPIGIQLGHAGRKGSNHPRNSRERDRPLTAEEGAWTVVGPSALSYDPANGWPVPEALEKSGLARVRDAFANAARRAHRSGFDLVEIHSAHGYLLHTFLSPISNRRTDRYGGSLSNRMRFPLEVAAAVREALPPEKPLGVRITGEDWIQGGLELADAAAYGQELSRIGVNYLTLSAGNIAPGVKFPQQVPGYMVGFSDYVREHVGIPTMAVGMICDAFQAESIIAEGKADMIGIARGIIDDPRWGLHAANALGVPADYPVQCWRAKPRAWPGYALVHGHSSPLQNSLAQSAREQS
jgi:2,4-dienoyl-CoA reductase-like NADH-dependent reductase (Old Yellow Enzyme family)